MIEKYEIPTPDYINIISKELNLENWQVQTVIELTSQWATVPFISRYRKEQTWNLDENQIRSILEIQKFQENINKTKQTAINWIAEQNKLTEELLSNILACKTLKEVEEIYKPYKSKRKTKAMIAIEKWFQIVADNIKLNKLIIPNELLEKYSQEEILEWAVQIIWAEITANLSIRHFVLDELKKYWIIKSNKKSDKMLEKLNEKNKKQIYKFEIYFEFETKIKDIKAYQVLALNRWEKLWILNVKVIKDIVIQEKTFSYYLDILWLKENKINEFLEWFKIWFDSLYSSIDSQIRSELNEFAENESIQTFQTNLSNLLMTKPQYWQKILAIDPWFKAGCKIVLLDELWNPLKFDKIFLNQTESSKDKIKNLVEEFWIDVIVIWNWTWTQEIQQIVSEIFDKEIYIVNESWASVYSVSDIAIEEFPDLNDLDRWTISIARRYIDPLSELVKVPVWSIWVWLYQHDLAKKKLEEKLWYVVEDSVNKVWINVNTASIYLLNHISWIDKKQAKKIYKNRPYKNRKNLEKILSSKVYEQAIWFLRVPKSDEELDQTDIHPEQYELAKYIIKNNKNKLDEKMKEIYPSVNQITIDFILNSYKNIAKDPRENFAHTKINKSINIDELKEWDILEWLVRNVVAFGAFVDIWLKNDWLVHISHLSNEFVKDPMDIVKVWDKVKVKVIKIDLESWKINLSMKDL